MFRPLLRVREKGILKKSKTSYFCRNCGYESPKWLGKCPACNEWNALIEEDIGGSTGDAVYGGLLRNESPLSIDAIEADEKERIETKVLELDRVLGVGLSPVPPSSSGAIPE